MVMDIRNTMPPAPQIPPRLVIIEQPKQRGMRFRYLCEGRSAGSIPGESTTAERKTWPAVQIQNYQGEVTIRVSLVSTDKIPRPHPHSLVGKDCSDGICTVRVTPETQMTATFSNLGVQCVKRKEVFEALKTRQRLQVDPFNSAQNNNQQTTDIDLNVVLLCFEAFINQGNFHYVIQPVLSNPIYDKKATGTALLRICRVDRSCGSCKGGDEVYLLCDKVQKDDITICFFDVESGWEAYGEFSPTDVHRQVAIVFRTPAYKDQNIVQATKVLFQLRRASDHETSDSKEFTYLPSHHAQPSMLRGPKRRIDQTAKDQLRQHIGTKNVRIMNPTPVNDMQRMFFQSPSPLPFYPQQPTFPGTSAFSINFSQEARSRPVGHLQTHSPGTYSHMQQARSSPAVSVHAPQISWREELSSDILNPEQTMSQLQNFPSPSSLLEMSNFSLPAVPSNNPAVEGYEEAVDSIASFKGIETEGMDLNESLKQMSLEPMEQPVSTVIKTEPQPPSYFPSHNSTEDIRVTPMGVGLYSSNFNVAVASPESYSVQSPPQNSGVYRPLPNSGVNHLHQPVAFQGGALQSLNADSQERLPSFDLSQQLPSALEEDILYQRPGGN